MYKKPNIGESAADLYPQLIEWWDNDNEKTFHDYKPKSAYKAQWVCPKFKHKFKRRIYAQSEAQTCPECNKKINQSSMELMLLFELKHFFNTINEKGQKITTENNSYNVDINIPTNIIIEWDGVYWHKNQIESDNAKVIDLTNSGYRIIRIRENGLPKVFEDDIVLDKFKQSEKENVIITVAAMVLSSLNVDVVLINKYLSNNVLVGKVSFKTYIQSNPAFGLLTEEQVVELKFLYLESDLSREDVCKLMKITKSKFFSNTKFFNIKKDRSGPKNIKYKQIQSKDEFIKDYESDVLLVDIATKHDLWGANMVIIKAKEFGIYKNRTIKYVDKNELKLLFESMMSIKNIAESLDVSRSLIVTKLNEYGLYKFHKDRNDSKINDDEFILLYESGLKNKDLAENFNTSTKAIQRKKKELRFNKIQTGVNAGNYKNIDKVKFIEMYESDVELKDIGQYFDISNMTVISKAREFGIYKDRNNIDIDKVKFTLLYKSKTKIQDMLMCFNISKTTYYRKIKEFGL